MICSSCQCVASCPRHHVQNFNLVYVAQQADSADESDSQQLQWSNDAKALARRVSDTLATSGKDGPSNRELLQLLQQQSQLISKYQTRLDHTNATLLQYQKMLQRISTKLEVCSSHQKEFAVSAPRCQTLQSSCCIHARASPLCTLSYSYVHCQGMHYDECQLIKIKTAESVFFQVPSPSASDGYTNIALPETLSDKSIRDRSSADSSTSENEWRAEGSSDLLQGQRDAPASNNILYTPPDPRVIKYLPHRGTRQAPGGPAWSAGDRRALGGFDARFHSTSAYDSLHLYPPLCLRASVSCTLCSASQAKFTLAQQSPGFSLLDSGPRIW